MVFIFFHTKWILDKEGRILMIPPRNPNSGQHLVNFSSREMSGAGALKRCWHSYNDWLWKLWWFSHPGSLLKKKTTVVGAQSKLPDRISKELQFILTDWTITLSVRWWTSEKNTKSIRCNRKVVRDVRTLKQWGGKEEKWPPPLLLMGLGGDNKQSLRISVRAQECNTEHWAPNVAKCFNYFEKFNCSKAHLWPCMTKCDIHKNMTEHCRPNY